jgi:hypothetical protein
MTYKLISADSRGPHDRVAAALRVFRCAHRQTSEQNPRNPNKPPRDVYWGERTVDEMGHAAILYTLDDEKLK